MRFRWFAEATYDGLPAASVARGTGNAAIRAVGDPLALPDPESARREPAVSGRRSGER